MILWMPSRGIGFTFVTNLKTNIELLFTIRKNSYEPKETVWHTSPSSVKLCVCVCQREWMRRGERGHGGGQGGMPKATWAPDKVGYDVTVITQILASHTTVTLIPHADNSSYLAVLHVSVTAVLCFPLFESPSACVCLYKCFSVPIFSFFCISTLALSLSFLLISLSVSVMFSPTRCPSSSSYESLLTIHCTAQIQLHHMCNFPRTS